MCNLRHSSRFRARPSENATTRYKDSRHVSSAIQIDSALRSTLHIEFIRGGKHYREIRGNGIFAQKDEIGDVVIGHSRTIVVRSRLMK